MWHPLTTISHMLDCQLFGLNPTGHHLVSVAIHIVNALLLFWILKNITGTMWASAFVAAVFALHPVQVESVAWAAERKTVLSGLFWLLTMAAYIRYARQPRFEPIYAAAIGIRSLYYDQAGSCNAAFRAAIAGLLALERIRWRKTEDRRQKTEKQQVRIRRISTRMADTGKNTAAGNVGIFKRDDIYFTKTGRRGPDTR